ncbi:MAG: LPP20 family lipoprotein [Pseudomonadota bacterium]|nr:LPP20 family lipoprotein [Pseudomonadota bacterium]
MKHPNRCYPLFICGWLMVSALTACSQGGGTPQWIDDPQAAYPGDAYLTALGQGDDRDTAASRALANLARTFEVAITDTSLDFSSAEVSNVAGQAVVQNEQKVTRQVSTEARQVLEGARVVEFWESEQGRVSALAVLARQPAANRFRQAIMSLDRAIQDRIQYASGQADSPVAALQALRAAREAQVQRDQVNRNLMVVADGAGVPGRYDTAAVDTLIRNALSESPMAVSADDASIKAEIQQALATLGIPVVAQSNLLLEANLDVAPMESRQAWYWLRGSYELIFRDDTRVLAKQRWPVKVSSTEPNLLSQRLRDQINRQLPNYVFELLSSDGGPQR